MSGPFRGRQLGPALFTRKRCQPLPRCEIARLGMAYGTDSIFSLCLVIDKSVATLGTFPRRERFAFDVDRMAARARNTLARKEALIRLHGFSALRAFYSKRGHSHHRRFLRKSRGLWLILEVNRRIIFAATEMVFIPVLTLGFYPLLFSNVIRGCHYARNNAKGENNCDRRNCHHIE